MDRCRVTTFIAIYRGRTASDARLVSITSDPAIVATVVEQVLANREDRTREDPVIDALDRARRHGLRLVQRELREQRP